MRKALTFILALMLMACSSSSDEVEKTPSQEEEKQPMLSFYVYAPEHPLLTRATVGDVNPIGEEAQVNSLQIWVFETANGKLVAYYEPQSADDISKLNNDEGNVYQVPVTHDFANRRPRVDVFVLANATNSTAGSNATRAELEAALLSKTVFGYETLARTVPEAGLPMSGVLKDQPVTGEKPVLRIGTDFSAMATVRLVRAVSKLRFVFSALTGSNLAITGITIDAGLMTDEEYLFLNEPYNGSNYHIKSYLSSAVPFISATESPLAVKEVTDPLEYIFIDGVEDAQYYEKRICEAIDKGTLTSWGPFYLPESDKKLTGTITYTVGGSEMPPAEFKMTDEGDSDEGDSDAGDFTRNHTWLVYAYYGDAVLQFNLVKINNWSDKDVRNHDVYNW